MPVPPGPQECHLLPAVRGVPQSNQGFPDLMKLIPSMVSAVFPPTDKTGKSFPEHCGGQTPTPHHHVSSRRFKQREGLALRAVSSVPEGTPAPGAGGVTPPETSPTLALGQRSSWSRGACASAPGPAPLLHTRLSRSSENRCHTLRRLQSTFTTC